MLKRFVLAVAVAAASHSAAAADKWNMTVEQPDGNYITVVAREFAQDVAKATNGALEIKVHSNSVLFKRTEVKRAVQTGQVPIGDVLMSVLGNEDAVFEVDSVPLLARNFDQAEKLWAASRSAVAAKLEKQGIKVLYSVPWPPQSFFTKSPINTLADLKGVRFRAYNAATARLIELMGAAPTTVATGEVPQAFSAGVIEAMITSPATGVDTQAWDFSKYYYDVNAFIPKNFVIVNLRAFNKLPEASRKAVLDAAARAEKKGWELARSKTQELVQTLGQKGMQIKPTPPAVEADLAKIAATMKEEWLKRAGQDGRQILDAYSAK